MRDERKSEGELLGEVRVLRSRIAELEQTPSKLKGAGDSCRSLEKQLKDILDNTPVGVYQTTPDGRILMANPALVRMLGYSSFEELAQRNLEKEGFEPCYPRSMFKERIEKDGQVIGLESVWIKRDGTTLVIVETAWAFRDKQGRTLYYEGIVQDVTELKKSKEALEKSEQEFRSIFDNAADGIVLADVESKKFLIGNKAFSQMLGRNPEDIKNLWVTDIHPREDLPYVIEQFERQLRREISLARDIPVKRKDGSVFYADVNAFPVTLAGKEYLAGIFRDVTERKEAEEKLKQYQFMVESAHDAIFFKDLKSRYVIANNKALEAFGLSRDQVIGKNDYEIMPDKEEAKKNIQDDKFVFKTGKPAEITKSMTGADGKNRWFQAIKVPQFDGKGNIIGLVGIARDITERKKAEEACRLSEEKFAKAFNSSPAAIFITTLKEGRFIDLNESAIKVFGYTREEVVGHTAKELNMWANYNDRDIVVQSIRREIDVRDMEARFRRKSGELFDGIISVDIINIGGTECLISTVVDITERKRAEDALRESERLVRAILDATTESVLMIDKQGTILAINETAAQRLGRSVEEIVGLSAWDAASGLIPPDLIKSRQEQLNEVIRSGEPVRFEDNRRGIIFDNNMFPIFDEKGRVTRLAIFARDITEQRKDEEMLWELKYRYQTLFESAPVGIGVSTREGQVLECNDAMLKMLGYSESEVRQINLTDTYQDPQQRQELLKRLERDGFIRGFEVQLKQKDGTAYYASLTIAPFIFDGQNVLLTVQEDITERKQAQEMLANYREKMIRAKQLASLGTLGATLVHEITQPLTVITLSIENALTKLKTMSCPATVTRKLKDSLTGASSITSIVERFRNDARKSSEGITEEVKLEPVAERTVRFLSESARRARVTLRLKGLDELPPVYSSEKDMEQLFFALIENAIQAATGKKDRQVVISGDVEGDYVQLRFADNCGGITPENLGKIFELFFTTKPAGEGTGLGLCIVEHVVSRAGGKVRVESKAGKGSTFFVTLPISAGEKS